MESWTGYPVHLLVRHRDKNGKLKVHGVDLNVYQTKLNDKEEPRTKTRKRPSSSVKSHDNDPKDRSHIGSIVVTGMHLSE